MWLFDACVYPQIITILKLLNTFTTSYNYNFCVLWTFFEIYFLLNLSLFFPSYLYSENENVSHLLSHQKTDDKIMDFVSLSTCRLIKCLLRHFSLHSRWICVSSTEVVLDYWAFSVCMSGLQLVRWSSSH